MAAVVGLKFRAWRNLLCEMQTVASRLAHGDIWHDETVHLSLT